MGEWAVAAVCLTVWLVALGCAQSTDTHDKIQYHLTELRKELHELNHRRVHKRAATPDYDEIIFRSLTSFCAQMNANQSVETEVIPETTTPPENVTSLPENPEEPEDTYTAGNWSGPGVFPSKVVAKRQGDQVDILFIVVHTGPLSVMRLNSFDYDPVSLDHPGGDSPIESKVSVSVDVPVCRDEGIADDVKVDYGFSLGEAGSYHVFASLDICMFDQKWNETKLDGAGWERIESTMSHHVPLPHFKVVPDPGDDLVLKKGRNSSVDVVFNLYRVRELAVLVSLWDRDLGEVLKSRVRIFLDHSGNESLVVGQIDGDNGEGQPVLTTEIIQEESLNVTDNSEGYTKNTSATIRLTMDTANGKRSGKLNMIYTWREPEYYKRPIVRFLQTSRTIRLKLPNRERVFPKNNVDIFSYRPFKCDEYGTMYYPKQSRNCTIFCHASGTDIQTIKLKKVNPYRAPVRSVSYVIDDSAFAMLDLGPASSAVEGTYRCIVTTANGKRKRKDLKMFTSSFTVVNNLTLEYFSNGTAKVTCVARGLQPLNVSVSASDDQGNRNRLDDKDVNSRFELPIGDKTTVLAVYVPVESLRFPTSFVVCDGDGEAGRDSKMEFLPNNVTMVDEYYPRVDQMPNATYAANYGNGTVALVCSAVGAQPMSVQIESGDYGQSTRIDDKPENNRTVTETQNRTTLTLAVPAASLAGESPWVTCKASNSLGSTDFTFNIRSFTRV